MRIWFILVLIIFTILSQNANAVATESNNSSREAKANEVSIMEKTSISDLIIIFFCRYHIKYFNFIYC